jgi:hypothetical protein
LRMFREELFPVAFKIPFRPIVGRLCQTPIN